MSDRIVVDTDVVSYAYKGDSRFLLFAALLNRHELYVSFVTVAELYYWALSRNWGQWAQNDLSRTIRTNYVYVGADSELCRLWATIRDARKRLGREMPEQDAWIAATAIQLDAPLATNNRADFMDIPGLRLV